VASIPVLSGTNGHEVTVEELRKRMTQSEMIEWAALFNLRPWGEECDDIRHGILTMVVANSAYGSRGTSTCSDFVPKWGIPVARAPFERRRSQGAVSSVCSGNEPS